MSISLEVIGVADEVVVYLAVFAAYLGILGIGGIIADYVLPHIPLLCRWIDSLPEKEDDNEICRREMERVRRNRAERTRRIRETIRRLKNGNRV